MFSDKSVWGIACELARTGHYANVIIIERELRRRGVLNGHEVTGNIVKREFLTRMCHAARNYAPASFGFHTLAHEMMDTP